MSKLSFRARALDASKPMPIYLAEELPDLPDYSAINRAVPQMPSGMEKEEECEHHLQRAICTGLIIPTPEVSTVNDLQFYERCYPPDYKMPKQHIHMQPLWQEQETPEYDIDSEDERWLKQQRHPELTELKFEQMMDKLERSSGQTVVSMDEAKLLLERSDDLVIAVFDYWLNKRLKTQHPLILAVKTESRPGQSANNPYLAFRRRTEKMQTRKNRKNDESSYEKMLKLRRDLARALSLLEMVSKRERAKRDLVKMTALLAEKRYQAGDFAGHMLAEIPQSRSTYSNISVSTLRRDAYVPPRPTHPPHAYPADVRQREKRPYKRRKRHHGSGTVALRDSGVYSSSSSEGGRAEAPPDDGPYAFRRKPGCYYEMPTSTLYGDPVDPDNPSKDGYFEHELDNRLRYTLTSLGGCGGCVGFGRRRVGRGGRLLLDRRATPLDDLWPRLGYSFTGSSRYKAERAEELNLETERHREPKTLTRDYDQTSKYPWRRAFRKHLKRNSDIWTVNVKEDSIKDEPMDVDIDSVKNSDNSVRTDSVKCGLVSVLKRPRSGSESSYDSDSSLQPVEEEFAGFISEVNKKWLHFRPKTPPVSPPRAPSPPPGQSLLLPSTPLAVELTTELPSHSLDTFTTSEFTLNDLYGDNLLKEDDSLDISGEDLLNENLGLTEAQVESILSETDLKALADVDLVKDKKLSEDILDELVKDVDVKDPFLLQGQGGVAGGPPGAGRAPRGHSAVRLRRARPPHIYVDCPAPPPPAPAPPPPPAPPAPPPAPLVPKVEPDGPAESKEATKPAAPKKSSPPRRPVPRADQRPQILTVAVSDTLKVRLQNHLLSTQSVSAGSVSTVPAVGTVVGLVPNGPYAAAAQRDSPAVSIARTSTPLVVTHAPLHHMSTNKLKVLHAGGLGSVVSLPAQLIEIKGKGPHVVNVLRPPPPGSRLDQERRRQLLALDGGRQRPHRLSVSLDGRQLVRTTIPAPQIRAPLRQQLQLKNRTVQVANPALARTTSEPSSSITIAGGPKTASIPSSVVANLLQKNVQLPKTAQKIAISGATGQTLAANVQAIAFTTAQLKARQARLITQPRPATVNPPAAPAPPAPRSPEAERRGDTLQVT